MAFGQSYHLDSLATWLKYFPSCRCIKEYIEPAFRAEMFEAISDILIGYERKSLADRPFECPAVRSGEVDALSGKMNARR